MKHKLAFSLIIPNLNGQKYLVNCLDSLTKSISPLKKYSFEFILVDNASTDNSVNIFCRNIPKKYSSKVILNSKNLGFAAAINQGVKSAKHPYVVLINNDLTVEKNWFSLVIKEIENNQNPKVATYCGTVLNIDGTKFESQGLRFFVKGKCQNISNGKIFKKSLVTNKKPRYIWGSSAALVVYHKKIITQIGLFDEHFFAYEEDVDLAYRLNKLKYKTLYIPPAISYHLGGGTSGNMGTFRYRMDAKNWFFIILKNYPLKVILLNLPQIFEERLRNLSGLIKSHFRQKNLTSILLLPITLIQTYFEVLTKTPTMLSKRLLYQKLTDKG